MDTANDVIPIESSDSDSDCQIVSVVPSLAKRGKNKLRWRNRPLSNTQGARTNQRGREMTMRQLNEAAYEGRPSMSSASRGYPRRTRSEADDLPDTERNNTCTFTRTGNGAIQHVDLEDPCSVQLYTAGSNTASISFPCLAQNVVCKQEPRHQDEDEDEDEERSTRSRSGSTVTLDFSPGRQSYEASEKDVDGIIGKFDEPSKWTELIDTRGCTTLDACIMGVVSQNGDYSSPTHEPSLEKSELEPQNRGNSCEMDSLFRLTDDLPNNVSSSVQPHKEVSSESRRQGYWGSVINFAAFEALPGPLFTRPKQVLGEVTYKAVMEDKATQEAKERKGKYNT